MRTFELMLGYTWGALRHEVYNNNCLYKLTCAVFFSSTHLGMRTEPQMVHACLHKIYPQVFFEQEVLHVLAELSTSEITRIACVRITTHDFPLS